MFEQRAFIFSFLVLPSSCFIPNGLNHDLASLFKSFNIHSVTKIHKDQGSTHLMGSNPRQQNSIAEFAAMQGVFVNHVKCTDIDTRYSAVSAVFYPATSEDQPCDLTKTATLVAGSSVNRPLFLYSFEETSIPRWIHEMYVPFNARVNVILQDKRDASWLTLQEVYHLDDQGSNLVVNDLGRREVCTSRETRWRLTSNALELTRRANLRGATIRTAMPDIVVKQPTDEVSVLITEANKTMGMACAFLNASVREFYASNVQGLLSLVYNITDLVIHPVVMSADASSIDFTTPYGSVRNRIYIRRPAFTYSLRSMMQSFSLAAWITISVAMVAMSATMTLASRVTHGLDLEDRSSWSESVVKALGSACAQGWDRTPRSHSGRCVLLSTVIAGYLLNTFFVLQLQSGLSAQTSPLPFRGLDELVQTDYQIYTKPQGVAFFAIKRGKTELAEKARQKSISEKNADIRFEDVQFCEKRIAYIAVKLVVRMFSKLVNCTLVDTKVDLFLASSSFPMRRNYQFKQLVDLSFRRSVEGGLVQRNERMYQDQVTVTDDIELFRVVDLRKVGPFLLAYMYAIGVSVAIFALELACFHWFTFWLKVSEAAKFLVRLWRRCVHH